MHFSRTATITFPMHGNQKAETQETNKRPRTIECLNRINKQKGRCGGALFCTGFWVVWGKISRNKTTNKHAEYTPHASLGLQSCALLDNRYSAGLEIQQKLENPPPKKKTYKKQQQKHNNKQDRLHAPYSPSSPPICNIAFVLLVSSRACFYLPNANSVC